MSTHRSSARRRFGLALAPAALAALAVTGTASATGADPTCVVPSEVIAYSNTAQLPVCAPNLELSKTGPKYISPGIVTWNIIVWHAGYPGASDPFGSTVGIPITAIHVNDTSLGLTDLTPDPEYGLPKDGILYPGRAIVYTVKQNFTPKICGKVSVSNTADMTVDVTQSTTADDTDTISVPVKCNTDVGIVKTADKATYAPGDTVTWTVTVTNKGGMDIPVSRIQVNDEGVTLTPAASNPADTLAEGQSLTFTATTTAKCGTMSNTATVALTGTGPVDANSGDNSSTATVMGDGAACAPPAPTEQSTTPAATTVGTPSTGTTGTPAPQVCPRVTVSVRINAAKRPHAGALSSVVLNVKARNTAKSVRLTYRAPSGYAITSKPGDVKLRHGVVVADLGTITAGQTKRITLGVQILRTATGKRQHSAAVTANCASTARTTAAASVRPMQGAVQPAVTG